MYRRCPNCGAEPDNHLQIWKLTDCCGKLVCEKCLDYSLVDGKCVSCGKWSSTIQNYGRIHLNDDGSIENYGLIK